MYYVLATQLQSQDPQQATQTQLTLQRLGSEIHGPTPEMRISKAQILFTEELRPDSPLVQAIRELKAGGGAPPAQVTPAPATPTPIVTATATPTPTPTATPTPSPSP